MNYYIFRNMTVERLFGNLDAEYSGYGDLSHVPDAARYIWCYLSPLKSDNRSTAEEIESYAESLRFALAQIPSGRMLLAFTIDRTFGIDTVLSDTSVADAISDYNRAIRQIASSDERVKVIDFAGFLNNYPFSERLDWKYYFISQMAINPRLTAPFQKWFAKQVDACELKRRKCLVLDLDNTLWGGVLGEEGVAGVALGGDYPGKAFLLFQQQLRELTRQGVMLAVCSKNNIEEVREMWATHPDAVLKEDSFVALKVNWTNKAENIRQIADELNIGVESLVFIDDNPAERLLVSRTLPGVAVPDFPTQPYLLPSFLKEVAETYFSVYALTNEDLDKTEQYKANTLRSDLKNHFVEMEEYIRNLQIKLKIERVNDITLPRAAQMTQKTNQFNLTTRRYTDADIRHLLECGSAIYTLGVSDRFGESGISGLCIVKLHGNEARIESFLLSCRILGKGIENAFLSYLLREWQAMGVVRVEAEYISTPKNGQTANFYDCAGFTRVEGTGNETIHYSRTITEEIALPESYQYE